MRLVGIAFVGLVVACSSRHPQRPPESADCLPGSGVACGNPVTVGGGGGNPGADSGTAYGSDGASSGALCGNAPSLVSTDQACQMCATTNCCTVAQQCVQECQSLLSCIGSSCTTPGDTTCFTNLCQTPYMGGLTAYSNFKGCLALNCTGSCPTLP
jgi:hypothetical protein